MPPKFTFLLISLLGFLLQISGQQVLLSPNGKIKVVIETSGSITYAVYYNSTPIIFPSPVDLKLYKGASLSEHTAIRQIVKTTVSDSVFSPVPEKRRWTKDEYNEMAIRFKQPFSLVFRAYNDGIAYRFKTHFKDSVIIGDETAVFNFPAGGKLYYPEVEKRSDADSFHTSFEAVYQYRPVDSIANAALFFNPVLFTPATGPKIVVTESDIEDYPGMFQRGTSSNSIVGCFAHYPVKEKLNEADFPQWFVTQRAPYIAVTRGTRAYPWRVLAIAATDAELPGNDIVYRLASPSRVKDVSWVHPGKGTDEWIIGVNLFNIPFKAGINTATYKYYIDFAKQFGFDRIMLDAGWSDYTDLFKIKPGMNMEELASYARSKGIKLSMWTLASTLNRQLDSALLQFKKWGVDFIMTDFMDRDDQKMVNFYFRIAEACARNKIMIMFHGAFKPAGFNRTYPNAITRESVLGSEYNIWSNKADPHHDLLLPYIRMVAGPLDYEPGILDNATEQQFKPIGEKVMSMGTRTHQLAMFVVYDNPMQIFSGNPSQGLLEPAFMKLLGGIPTTWDETRIIDGSVGEYIVTAREKGNDWYIAAMSNWKERDLKISLDFLPAGGYEFEKCEDGINANRYPSDYSITKGTINHTQTLELHLVQGGGYLIHLKKK